MAPHPMCKYKHGTNQCQAERHTTSGGNVASLCTLHYKRSRSKRPKAKRSEDKDKQEVKRAKDARDKAKSRQQIQDAITAIEDPRKKELCQQMARMKTEGIRHLIISDIVNEIEARGIRRTGPKDPINFTDPSARVTRHMQLVSKPHIYIPHVLDALKFTFPGCTTVLVKLLTSTNNDPPQLTHTDFDLRHIHDRVSSLKHFHYSAIIALEPHTHILIGEERVRIDIPVNAMLLFRGDLPHAGGGYAEANARLFISLSSSFYPLSSAVYIVK